MEKRFLSADGYQRDCWRLSSVVRASRWKPDAVLALWRGGASAGVALHEFFKATGWDVRHYPLKCESYSGIGENSGEVKFSLGAEMLKLFSPGEKVLVVDDVFDTGRTAKAVVDLLSSVGVEPKVACVYWKREKSTVDIVPDYFSADVSGEWIVFPHEIDGLSAEEIKCKDAVLFECLERLGALPR